jgi:predicted glycogen debranching enzyme
MNTTAEWLEADGLGGFACGTISGIRSRRYHALLLPAVTPPTGRMVLVNGVEAWIETPSGSVPLTSHLYHPDVTYPDGAGRIESFTPEPWPRWQFAVADGIKVIHEIFVPRGAAAVVLTWRLVKKKPACRLFVRPLLSGRDYHALQRENPSFAFAAEVKNNSVSWQPCPDVPRVTAFSNGEYEHQPDWYRNFLYEQERARGLDCIEDLASPGVFRWDLAAGEAVLVLAAVSKSAAIVKSRMGVETAVKKIRAGERPRRGRLSRLDRSAEAYIVNRGEGKTIVAGYPWFTDWGRDTFIAVRGLCLATGKLDLAREILLTWAETVSEGMMPNRFPDQGATPEYNAVDASLWYVVAVHDFLVTMAESKKKVTRRDQKTLWDAVDAILDGYARGTRFGIRADTDGLLAAGEPGVALTWMDAVVEGHPLTTRIGKPVEVQALWLNALWIRRGASKEWADLYARGSKAFRERFWNEAGGCLYDVIDCQHQPGMVDASFRPNQIFAVGGLPETLLQGEQARRVVEAVESRLWTPLGLRTLAPDENGYRPRYEGGVPERDQAYHRGTVWPWLAGPFVEAWLRVRGGKAEAKKEARARFLAPLLQHLDDAGLGHISELADGDPPHTPRGCPFQAWSLAEVLRLDRVVLK